MSNIENIESRVYEVIGKVLQGQEGKITPEARFRDDLEADSLDLVEIIMALESEFGKDISDAAAQNITTVGEAIIYIYENSNDAEGGSE
jgi:acyl carrier protein